MNDKAVNHPLAMLWSLVMLAPRRGMFLLSAVMILIALTEGFGIVMLVPLLDALAGDGAGKATQSLFGFIEIPVLSLGVILAMVVGLTLFRAALQYYQSILSSKLQFVIVDDLRQRCFNGLLHAEWRWLAERNSADHASLLVTNIARIGSGLTQAIGLVALVFSTAACLAAAFLLSWEMAVLACVGGAVLVYASRGQRRHAVRLGQDLGHANRALQGQIQDGLRGIRLAKILGKEADNLSVFTAVLVQLRGRMNDYIAHSALNRFVLQMSGALAVAAMVYVGVVYLKQGYAILLPLVVVFARLVPILGAMQQSYHHWLHAMPAMIEAQQLLAETALAAEPVGQGEVTPLALSDALLLDEVRFTYANRKEPAANGITLSIKARTTTAIIGHSGAGKSTLADMIMGLIEPDDGRMTVDGLPILGDMRLRWRRSVAYVQQEAFLFNDSIRSNLLWSRPSATADEIDSALQAAAADFVYHLPHGIDTIVGDGGTRLSGGERQRVALARALLGTPSLLILDEATSALDRDSEAAIRRAIAQLHGNMTIIVIGHRLTMLEEADQIVELRKGRLIAPTLSLQPAGSGIKPA